MNSNNLFKWIFKSSLLIIGIALLIFGVFGITCAFDINRTLKNMKQPLLELPVDLSKVGTYSANIPEVKNYFHGLVLIIEVIISPENQHSPETLLEGFSGAAKITAQSGKLIAEIDITAGAYFSPKLFERLNGTHCFIFLESFPEFEGSNCDLSIAVKQGASNLTGQEQTMVLRYNLCGMESMALVMSSVFGVISSLVGIGISLPISIHFIKRFKLRNRRTIST